MLWFFESFFPAVWIAFLLYWQIKATHTKTTQRLDCDLVVRPSSGWRDAAPPASAADTS